MLVADHLPECLRELRLAEAVERVVELALLPLDAPHEPVAPDANDVGPETSRGTANKYQAL